MSRAGDDASPGGTRSTVLFDTVREFDPLLSAEEAARVLGISVKTIYLWVKIGRLLAVPLGGRVVKFRPDYIAAIYAGRRNL